MFFPFSLRPTTIYSMSIRILLYTYTKTTSFHMTNPGVQIVSIRRLKWPKITLQNLNRNNA